MKCQFVGKVKFFQFFACQIDVEYAKNLDDSI